MKRTKISTQQKFPAIQYMYKCKQNFTLQWLSILHCLAVQLVHVNVAQ